MGSFNFKWEHPATDVYVTGTFDDWSKSEKLAKSGHIFEKTVTLPDASNKIYYKFVVDGNWIVDHSAPQENDESGNLNNVLTPERISKHTTHSSIPAAAAVMSSAAPDSTTADLAKGVPLEKTGSSDLPGAFPETPALDGGPSELSVNPIPATEGAGNPIKLAPGEKVPEPHTLTSNTINSTVKDDPTLLKSEEPKEQSFGVNPLPATAGIGNPIKLAAGEKVPEPSTFTNNTVQSTVSHDKSTYENGTGGAPFLPPVVTPSNERASNGSGVFDVPEVTKNMIPESSLPIGTSGEGTYDATPTIQSAHPQSTTAALAAAVPLESEKTVSGVPEIVRESQHQAGVDPEASAIPAEVADKSAFEKELLSEIPQAPATAEGTAGKGADESEKTVTAGEAAAAVGGAAVAIGGGLAAAAYAAKDKAVDAYNHSNITGAATTDATDATRETTDVVPEVVKESQAEAGASPEASAVPGEVADKSAFEKELLNEVPKVPTTAEGTAGKGTDKSEKTVTAGEAAAAVGGAAVAVGGGLAAAAYAAKDKAVEAYTKSSTTDETAATSTTSTVPEVVKESQKEAGAAPEASAVPAEVADKSAFEKELLSEVPKVPSTAEGTAGKGTDKSEKSVSAGEAAAAVGGAAVAVGGGVAAAAYAAKDKAVEAYNTTDTTKATETVKDYLPASTGTAIASAKSTLPTSIQESINSINTQSAATTAVGGVPEVVKESIAESGQGPEAAGFQTPVAEKKAVEKELLSELKPETASGEPAPQILEKQDLPIRSLGTTDGLNAPASTKAAGKQPEIASNAAPVIADPTIQSAPVVTSGLGSINTTERSTAPPATTTQTAPVVTDGVVSATTADKSVVPPKTPTKDTTPATTTSPAKSVAPVTPAKDTLPGVNIAADSAATSSPAKEAHAPTSPTKETNAPTSPSKATEAKNGTDSASAKKHKRLSFFGKLKAKFEKK